MQGINTKQSVANQNHSDVEGAVHITTKDTYSVRTVQANKDKKERLGKIPIILAVLLVAGIAVGIYFVVVSQKKENDDISKISRKPHGGKSLNDVVPDEITGLGENITSRLIEQETNEVNNGSIFRTDPACRDLAKSSVFVFDCYHQRTFNDLPDNSTVKCVYLNKVGSCIQALLEEEYGVECELLDQFFLLNLNAELLLERSNFNVKTECDEWYDFYKRTVGEISE